MEDLEAVQGGGCRLLVRQTNYGAGRGVYAAVNIERGEGLFVFSENVVRWSKATHRAVQLGVNRWLEPARGSYGWFLNHACEPSAAFRLPNKIVAFRDIREGEEITIDYATVIHMKQFELECCCPSLKCRKIIRSFQFMPRWFQEKYVNHNSLERR